MAQDWGTYHTYMMNYGLSAASIFMDLNDGSLTHLFPMKRSIVTLKKEATVEIMDDDGVSKPTKVEPEKIVKEALEGVKNGSGPGVTGLFLDLIGNPTKFIINECRNQETSEPSMQTDAYVLCQKGPKMALLGLVRNYIIIAVSDLSAPGENRPRDAVRGHLLKVVSEIAGFLGGRSS